MSQDVRFPRVINARPGVVFDEFTGQEGREAFYSEWARASSRSAICASAGFGP